MEFRKFTRTEGKGSVVLNSSHAVAVFATAPHTVIRTAAGGENTSFVVTEDIKKVVDELVSCGERFIQVTRTKDAKPLFINAAHVVGVYERSGSTAIRTTSGEHAEHAVSESIGEIEKKLSTVKTKPEAVSVPAPTFIASLLKVPKARRNSNNKASAAKAV